MRVLRQGLSMLLFGLAMLGLGCKDVAVAPTGLSYSANPASYLVGTAILPNSPTHSGGSIDSYAVSPALPTGLALDTKSGVISGTPTLAMATATYTVTGTNSAGSATASLSLTVTDTTITITLQPANQSVVEGLTATFSVAATGPGTLSYQWLKGATAIASATTASYTTPATVLADSGSTFSVQVSSTLAATVTSTSATLTVQAAAGPGTFLPTGNLTEPRSSHTATLLPSGLVLLVGGYDGTPIIGTADLFDPSSETFAPTTGSLTTARAFHTATLLDNGKVLIAGGTINGGTTASAELYDPATGTFASTTGAMGTARADHTATKLPGGKVLIVGGRNSSAYLATAELYDPATSTFTPTDTLPAARAGHTATLLGTSKVLIAGGASSRTINLSSTALYDPVAGTFSSVSGGMANPRAYHTATLLTGGKVLVVGGAATAVAELYDPTAGTFAATTGSLVTLRSGLHTATLLPSGKVLIAGGRSGSSILGTAELYDPASGANGSFTAIVSPMSSAREAHSATALGNGKVLLAGGYNLADLSIADLYY